ncbi:Scr1 family TA system antitoxin-like transcriptional regulator [Kitasatospora sp. NPDC088391]|uniref:helix-turn-helix domain-containing protein n=1 Tax=Kitasatospora sp. NPDC088391 TaxID=3364074 RepID=UPI00380325C4
MQEQAFCSPAFFAAELAEARENAGLSQGELARLIPCDRSLISRIEAGERVPNEDFARACDKLLNTGGLLLRVWQRVPWHQEVEHPDWFRRFAEMEARATDLRQYEIAWIPGLLQTPAYARAVLSYGDAAGDDDLISERVAARLGRQERFLKAGADPSLVVVLDEAVLRRTVGGPVVMAEQLRHLLELAQRPNIVIQVAPYDVGERAPFGASFTLLKLFEGPEWQYTESLSRGAFSNNPRQVGERSRAYDRLRAEVLSAPESARLILRIMEGLLNMDRKIDLSTAQWLKSSYSGSDGGQCVEVAYNFVAAGVVPVRDSKDPEGPALVFSVDAWRTFVTKVASGDFPTS